LTAIVPGASLVQAGHHTITLRNASGESDRFDFSVADASVSGGAKTRSGGNPQVVSSDGAPVLVQLIPADVHVGQPVGVQPDGQSAVSVSAEGAERGTVVVLDDQPLVTVFGTESYLTATLPSDIFERPGSHGVYLVDGVKRSNVVVFQVLP
jgi:hypothetical protein